MGMNRKLKSIMIACRSQQCCSTAVSVMNQTNAGGAKTKTLHPVSPRSSSSQRRGLHGRRRLSEEDDSTQAFTDKVSRDLSCSDDFLDQQEQQIRTALEEQNFVLNKLNLGEVELYGRECELTTLKNALDETCSSIIQVVSSSSSVSGPRNKKSKSCSLISVFGRAGTGKTRLARELERFVVENDRKGFFCLGKFELLGSSSSHCCEPYSAFVAAFSDLTRQILKREVDFQQEMCERIKDAIGDEGHILTSLVPELVELIGLGGGEDKELAHPPGCGAERDKYTTRASRLHYCICQFIKAVCSSHRPLVIVLDDMQWCDAASLELMSSLVTDCSISGLLLLTTCREEEVHSAHPFLQQLASLQNNEDTNHVPKRTQSIHIGNLDQAAVLSIVSTALRCTEEKTFKLSEIVHQKSSGNAMYVIQFLTALYDEGLLQYNLGLMEWTWEETSVRTRFVMDNVADLTAAKVQRLPSDCRTLLQTVSCLGQTFDKETLEFVLQDPRIQDVFANDDDVENSSWPAEDLTACLDFLVAEYVIDFIPQLDLYCFVHDLIQNAAFHLMPQNKCLKIQSEIGRCLLGLTERGQTSSKLREQYFFRAVDLSNTGSTLLSQKELRPLAKSNLEAGQKSMSKAAFLCAVKYLEEGMRCLGGAQGWTSEPQLSLALASGAVEASYCIGNFDKMETHIASVLRQDIPVGDKVRVYLTRILSLGAQNRNATALETGRSVLMEMGVTKLPKKPSTYHVLKEFLKAKFLLRCHTAESLLALPTLDDKRWIRAMSIVHDMNAIAYAFDIKVMAVMNLRMLRWSVTHGVCQYSPTAFAFYGLFLCGLGDLKMARMYGNVALSLSERLDARATLAKTILGVYGLTLHWTANLRTCLKPILYGHKIGMEMGEVAVAMHLLSHHGQALLITSATPLQALVPKMQANANLMRECKQEQVRRFYVLALQFALKLLGPSDNPSLLTGDVVNESEFRKHAEEVGGTMLLMFLDNYCLQLAYLFRDYKRADHFSRITESFGKIVKGHHWVTRNMFFRGLTALALAGQGCNRIQNMKIAARALSQLKKWAESGNVNCIHTVQILQAESAALRRNFPQARHLYEAAINTASRNGYLNDKALAHERALSFHLKYDAEDLFWAQNHYNDAVQAYCDWNAYEKARHLIQCYGNLLELTADSSLALAKSCNYHKIRS